MKNNKKDISKNSKKKSKVERRINFKIISKRSLELTIYIGLIILISLISFFGFYVKDKNTTVNKVKEYSLGPDLSGYRNIIVKVDNSTEAEVNADNAIEEENVTEEINENTTDKNELLTTENYDKARRIIEDRLKYIKLDYYEIKYNNTDGTINIKVADNDMADYVAEYAATKGEFRILDNDTEEVLLDNRNIKEAKVGYYTEKEGTTIYLNIEFDKEGKEKLQEISNIYRKAETENDGLTEETENEVDEEDITSDDNAELAEGQETEETATKQVTLRLDDTTIITTSFEEEISDGAIQLTLGTSSDSNTLKEYVEQATNIAVFLNSEPMPITYNLESNELVYADITSNELMVLIIILSICYLILWVRTVVKYGKAGTLGLIANIGFVAILLLLIRYANVEVTLGGIFAIFGAAVLEYVFLNNILKVYFKDIDKESKEKQLKNTLIRELEYLLPVTIIAIVFTLTKWKPITSVGMILFWGILEIIVCNLINIKIICKKEGK